MSSFEKRGEGDDDDDYDMSCGFIACSAGLSSWIRNGVFEGIRLE